MHHAHSALADANGADRSQQRTQSQSFQNRLQQHSLFLPLLSCHAEPAHFVFMDLNIADSSVFQKCFQLIAAVYGHTADDLRPLLVLVRVAIALVADEKGPAGLQHPANFREGFLRFRYNVQRIDHDLPVASSSTCLCRTTG